MPVSKVSLNYQNGVQKGPGTDYSLLLEMKRRQLFVTEAKNVPTGRKDTGPVVDSQKVRGFESTPANPVFFIRGAKLGFLKF